MTRLVLMFLVAAAVGAEPQVTIEKPWARATAPSAVNGAIFLTLVNAGDSEVTITAAESPAAEHVELHGHRAIAGGVEMYRMEAISVPAKGRVKLEPGGMHIMLLGVKAQLKEGAKLTLDLTVSGMTAPLHVDVPVLGIAAMGSETKDSCCE